MVEISIAGAKTAGVDERAELYEFIKTDDDLVEQSIRLMQGHAEDHEVATWFLKHHLESGGTVSSAETLRIYLAANHLHQWPALLHLLQVIPLLGIPKSAVTQVEALVRRCLANDNKFVRAWAYNGLHLLAEADDCCDSSL